MPQPRTIRKRYRRLRVPNAVLSLRLLTDRWIRVDNGSMTARWRLTVEESFSIRGRGTVVVGTLTGTGHNEAALVTTPTGQNFHVTRVVFDLPRQSKRGEIRYGVLLGAIDHKQLKPGTIVQPLDP
jgi:translation elongation factor EF-Tu-like GTPase